MNTPIQLKPNKENLYNNLIKELKRYYTRNKIAEPSRQDGIIYLEELPLIQRLNLTFNGNISFNLDHKDFMSYLTGLKRITIAPPFKGLEKNIDNIPNKNKITDLHLEGTDFYKIDLSEFTNLKSLTIVNNRNLCEIKGIERINNLEELSFYGNYLFDEKTACTFIASNMQNRCNMNIDILYYKRITSIIRKEYSKYKETFRNVEWIECIQAGLKNHQTISHDTKSTGKFYSRLDDIIAQILPRSGVDDLEAIYLITTWVVNNISYDHVGVKNKLKMMSHKTTLNINGKPQKINIACGMIGGTNGAFNAIYGKTVVCQGYTKLMQMLLKSYDYNIKTYDEAAYLELDNTKPVTKITHDLITKNGINHSIIRINLDDDNYYCDTTNIRVDENGIINQTGFMQTYEELDSTCYPSKKEYRKKAEPLTDEERESLNKLRLAHNTPYNYETKAVMIMEKFELHLYEDSTDINIQKDIQLSQVEDLLLLGIINIEVQRIINNQIENEYKEIMNNKVAKR